MIDKIPPQAIDLEESIIGALLLDSKALSKVNMIRSDMFYKDEHRVLFDAITHLSNNNRAVDILTVSQYLKDTGKIEQIGGFTAITKFTSRVASSAHITEHAANVYEKYLQR